MAERYTSKEIERLSKEFEKGTNLLDLEEILEDRPCYGILRKLQRLSEINPDKWDSDRIIEYVRQYNQQHKDEIAEKNRQYNQEYKDEIAERKRQHYQQHKDEIAERSRQHYQQHKDEIAERSRQHYQQHKDEIIERSRQYRLRRRKLKMCKLISDIRDIRDIGYEIGKINKNKGTITIELLEEGLNILLVKKDFEEHIQEAILNSKFQDLYYGFQLYYKENNLFISSKPELNEGERAESFLREYALILERERSN